MSEDFDVKQRAENIYGGWRSESNKKLSDKHPKEDTRCLMIKNLVSGDKQDNQ
jgi:hypothetical protein